MIRTGIDVVEIHRFETMKHQDAFLMRVFSDTEIAYITGRKRVAESIAGHYAAKEAFVKFLGTGLRGFGWHDMEVVHDDLGKPGIFFKGRPVAADVSITHSETVAVAVVCGEREENALLEENEEWACYRALLPRRRPDMHKGDCGRVFILAGSKGMTGAACLCARAALRCGSGLVTVGTPDSEQPVLAAKLTEAMTMPLPAEQGVVCEAACSAICGQINKSDVCALGPGLGAKSDLEHILDAALSLKKPMLIDADGLNALSRHIDILDRSHGDVVLTPHPGEMARLTGLRTEVIESARETVAQKFAVEHSVTLVLKGHRTVIASPDGEIRVNVTGNSGMASGGMGDVLSGVIASMMGQGLCGFDAAVLGVFLHGLAGDLAARRTGEFGLLAGDVAETLPEAFNQLLK